MYEKHLHSNVTLVHSIGPSKVNNLAIDGFFLIVRSFSHWKHLAKGGAINLLNSKFFFCVSFHRWLTDGSFALINTGQYVSMNVTYFWKSAVDMLCEYCKGKLMNILNVNAKRCHSQYVEYCWGCVELHPKHPTALWLKVLRLTTEGLHLRSTHMCPTSSVPSSPLLTACEWH